MSLKKYQCLYHHICIPTHYPMLFRKPIHNISRSKSQWNILCFSWTQPFLSLLLKLFNPTYSNRYCLRFWCGLNYYSTTSCLQMSQFMKGRMSPPPRPPQDLPLVFLQVLTEATCLVLWLIYIRVKMYMLMCNLRPQGLTNDCHYCTRPMS